MPSHISSTSSNVPMTSAIALSNSSGRTGIWYFQFSSKKWKHTWCAWIVWIQSLSPSNHSRSDHAPIVIVIQSEHLKYSISPRNQSAKHPYSVCFGISGVVIGSALWKGWRSGPEAFRAGHFLGLDRNRKPRMKSLWHPGYLLNPTAQATVDNPLAESVLFHPSCAWSSIYSSFVLLLVLIPV